LFLLLNSPRIYHEKPDAIPSLYVLRNVRLYHRRVANPEKTMSKKFDWNKKFPRLKGKERQKWYAVIKKMGDAVEYIDKMIPPSKPKRR
jgi:hypothetical protein